MADLAGRINIDLARQDGRTKVTVQSSRPIKASGVFVGKTVEETAASVASLFSICATAQACACASACEAALGRLPAPAVTRQRHLLVDAETVKEHLWRILLGWPGFIDEAPQNSDMAAVMSAWFRLRSLLTRPSDPTQPGADPSPTDTTAAAATLDELARLSTEKVLGTGPADWLAQVRTAKDLLRWAASADTVAAHLIRRVHAWDWGSAGRNRVSALPPLRALQLEPLLRGAEADRFAAEPRWRGEPRESTPFTRQRQRAPVTDLIQYLGNGLLSRLAAQLVELASLHVTLRSGLGRLDGPIVPLAEGTGTGIGIAQVPAARGLLVHRVALGAGRIRGYRILAPTEWNFHPNGVVAQGLSTLPGSDAATIECQARLFVTAVDPCVDYHVTIVRR